jgi:hypothetical protein
VGSGKGDFETYAQRRLELMGAYKNRRQTENFKHFDITKPSLLMRKVSSRPREPVSHIRGAFKFALRVSFSILPFNREGDLDLLENLFSTHKTTILIIMKESSME